jgi:hypothetical protein
MREKRTRYARLYPDGSLSVEAYGIDALEARDRLLLIDDDDDTEFLEVEIILIRSLGKPKLQTVRNHEAVCPTCGEQFFVDCHNVNGVEKTDE